MNRKQNVIIFSAGESMRSGKIAYIKEQLEQRNIRCADWHNLFDQAHHADQIALLPILAKKIPTFDFALIVADGVDEVNLRQNEIHKTMRDNVLFELGLCIMALGAERVILLAESCVHIPDDLSGIGSIGIKHITYDSDDSFPSSVEQLYDTIEARADHMDLQLSAQIDSVAAHIEKNAKLISPVFVGAAVSSAEAYFMNFVVRLLEHSDHFIRKRDQTSFPFPKHFQFRILIPTLIDGSTRSAIHEYYQRHQCEEFVIAHAGMRDLYFRGVYDEAKHHLTIIDIPTSVSASYSVVSTILHIDSDDEYDATAEERFITKESDIYEYTLKQLFTPQAARDRLAFLHECETIETIVKQLSAIEIIRMDMNA